MYSVFRERIGRLASAKWIWAWEDGIHSINMNLLEAKYVVGNGENSKEHSKDSSLSSIIREVIIRHNGKYGGSKSKNCYK